MKRIKAYIQLVTLHKEALKNSGLQQALNLLLSFGKIINLPCCTPESNILVAAHNTS